MRYTCSRATFQITALHVHDVCRPILSNFSNFRVSIQLSHYVSHSLSNCYSALFLEERLRNAFEVRGRMITICMAYMSMSTVFKCLCLLCLEGHVRAASGHTL